MSAPSTTRRAAIGVIGLAVPLALAGVASAAGVEAQAPDRRAWDLAMSRWQEAYERHSDAVCEAADALLAMSAPDRAAIEWKLEMIFPLDWDGEGDVSDSLPMKYANVLRADILRMIGGVA